MEFPDPTAVLIRPDGYVAWVGELTRSGPVDALTTWFGPRVEQLTRRQNSDGYRFEAGDRSALLTDLQRAALRWVSSFG